MPSLLQGLGLSDRYKIQVDYGDQLWAYLLDHGVSIKKILLYGLVWAIYFIALYRLFIYSHIIIYCAKVHSISHHHSL